MNIALSIDSTLKTMRQADLALTMERRIKSYLLSQHTLDAVFESEDVQRLLMADQMRYYLQYWHFEKCLNIIKAEWYDFYQILMLDPISGLIWLQGILDSQSMDEARELYQEARLIGIQNAIRSFDARGRVGQDLWDRLDALLVAGTGTLQYEDVVALDLSGGEAQWVYFEVTNAGTESQNAFISVSVPAGLSATQNSLDGLTGTWTTYPIGGPPIWHRNDTTTPTLVPIHMLYEYAGPFPAQETHRPGLLLQAATDGVYWVRTRVAMLPVGGNPTDQAAYARYPGSGLLDQQGWECLQIDATSGVQPCPNLTVTPSGPITAAVGQEVEIQITLSNANGCAPSVQTFVDVSHDSGLIVESVVPLASWSRYLPGDLIWFADGQQYPAVKTLWSQATTRMESAETRVYQLRVRSIAPGTQGLYVRCALRSAGMPAGTFVRSPESGPVDQQGWPVQTIVIAATVNQPPMITSINPPEAVVVGTSGEVLMFQVSANDPDAGPQLLSYSWSLDGGEILGPGPSISLDLSTLGIGQYTVRAWVSDGLANRHAEWAVSVANAGTIAAEMTSDVPSQFANTPMDDDLYQVAYSVNVTDAGGNGSFTYSWSAPVNPASGRVMALASGGGPADGTASYATPVVPPSTTEPYLVSCVVTGQQTGAATVVTKAVQVLPAMPIRGDLNCDWNTSPEDIGPFALALVDPAQYAVAFPDCHIELADMNMDTSVDGFDVQSFVNILLTP